MGRRGPPPKPPTLRVLHATSRATAGFERHGTGTRSWTRCSEFAGGPVLF